MNGLFRKFSVRTADAMGSSWAFVGSTFVIIVWAVSGPLFAFSDTWQLVINTGTTVLTFLAVFLIQNTQNRDAKAIHLKLDELLKGVEGARTGLVNLEEMPDEDIAELHEEFKEIQREENGSGPATAAAEHHLNEANEETELAREHLKDARGESRR